MSLMFGDPGFLLIDRFLYGLSTFYKKLKKICVVDVSFFQLFCPLIIEFRYYLSCTVLAKAHLKVEFNQKDDTGSSYILTDPLKRNFFYESGSIPNHF